MQNTANRITYIDTLKGLAIILVILGHIANGYMWDEGVNKAYFYVYNIIYSFHMPLFILLSGFTFYTAYCKKNSVQIGRIGKQILNLSILYVFWSLVLGVFKMIFSSMVNNPITAINLLMIPVKPIQLYWYLFILIVFYAIFGFLLKKRISMWLILVLTLCLSIASFWIPPLLIFDVKRLLYYSFFFALGIKLSSNNGMLFSANRDRQTTLQTILVAVLFVLAVIFCVVFWRRDSFLNNHFFALFIGLGLSLGIFQLFRDLNWIGNSRFLSWVGRQSLEIYLLHTFILSAFRNAFQKIGLNSPLIVIVLSLLAGLFIPLAISFICKKLKIYNIFFAPIKLGSRTRMQ